MGPESCSMLVGAGLPTQCPCQRLIRGSATSALRPPPHRRPSDPCSHQGRTINWSCVQRECQGVRDWGERSPQPPPGKVPAVGPGLQLLVHSQGPPPPWKIFTILFYGCIDIKANTIQAGFILIHLLSSICFLLILKEIKIRALSQGPWNYPRPWVLARCAWWKSQSCFCPAPPAWPGGLCTPQSISSSPLLIYPATWGF